jgi:hypothetical protein
MVDFCLPFKRYLNGLNDYLDEQCLKALVWFWLIDETDWTNPMSKCGYEIGWSKSK